MKDPQARRTTDTSTATTTTTTTTTTSYTHDVYSYTAPVVDILLIVEVPEGQDAFLPIIQGAVDSWLYWGFDFHAGATTIDESDEHGKLTLAFGKKWAEPTDVDPGVLLQELVGIVENTGSLEKGLDAVYKALEWGDGVGEPNEGFLRPDSEIAVIMLSYNDDAGSQISAADLITYLNNLRVGDSRVGFHSITISEDYITITNQVGGIYWSLFNEPLSPAMAAITDSFDPTSFELSQTPDESTLSVTVASPGGEPTVVASLDYQYDSELNAVAILTDPWPKVGDEVVVSYLPLAK